jgi:hypothetical protein
MARNPLQVQLVIDRVRCHEGGDGVGGAEPYLWTVFFKLDGDTVALGDDLFLQGRATVMPTPGSHGNLGDGDVDEGEALVVPSAIGELVTTLRPIPVPAWVTEAFGVQDVGGVVGVVTVLMEEDDVGHAGAEAGHAALDAFVRQSLDGLVPILGIPERRVTHEDADALTRSTERGIVDALRSAQAGWESVVAWLDVDERIGHEVFTFAHDDLAGSVCHGFSTRWRSEGDWELSGQVTAAPPCPAAAVLAVLRELGLLGVDAERHGAQIFLDVRRSTFAGNPELAAWWSLARRNSACIARVIHGDPVLARDIVAPLMSTLLAAAIDPDAPLPAATLVAMEALLRALAARGNRRLRIDAKAAMGVLPQLHGHSLASAAMVLCGGAPARRPRRPPSWLLG